MRVVPPMILGVVSDRRRLAAAAGRPMADAPHLLVEQAGAAAAAGADFYQLREPDLEAGPLLRLARDIVSATEGRRLRLYINDRADVAVAAGVHVHLRSTSYPAARLRAWLPPSTLVMRAVHSIDDIAAAGPVDAVLAGTVSRSESKGAGHATLGADGLRALAAFSAAPVIAIGGLTATDWPWLAACGVRGWAAIGAFLPLPGERTDAAMFRAVAASRANADRTTGTTAVTGDTPGERHVH